jgi:polar amino acid transport system substrate-binding protein
VDATYLVAAGSPIHKIADADRVGIRIAVSKRSVEEGVLRRLIQRAELLAMETPGADFEALRTGNVDVLATPRPRALQLSAQLPGSRVLDDSFHRTFGAMAAPKGHGERLAYISEFVEQAKASGLVQRAIERVGARGIQVAPPGYPPL